jgi:hypothetical protein
VHREEHLVREILDITRSDAEAAERAPDVRELELEERPKIDGCSVGFGDAALDIRTSHPCLPLAQRIHREK